MALPKQIKVGGSYYKGQKLIVSSSVGDYVLDMVLPSSRAGCVNGLTVTPDVYGAGDYFTLSHLSATSGGSTIATIADTIYNIGAGVTIGLDFSALENVKPDETIRLTYTNVATKAMNVYTVIERIR